MKISKRGREEFEFLLKTELDLIGNTIGLEPSVKSKEGLTALECWYSLSTYGKTLTCKEPLLLEKAIRSKASWNLQIKMWAETMAEGLLMQPELAEYTNGLPFWIFEATINQAAKLVQKQQGYVPRWCRLEYIHKYVLFPYMDRFMPTI